jgi:hypothetical protein
MSAVGNTAYDSTDISGAEELKTIRVGIVGYVSMEK